MSWVRRAFSIALFVATLGTMAAAILGVIDPLFMLIAWAALFADSLLAIDRHHRRLNRPAPAGPVRPDADVAQHLNDDDRAWLGEFAPDWTDPTPLRWRGHAQREIDRQLARPRRPAALTPTDCAVSAIAPLGAQVYVAPGPLTPESWPTVSPTSSAGSRSDLVIVRVEDPNAPEAGTWAEPADPAHGRYAFVRVIEGVPPATWDVAQVDSDWDAITLARIDRPASTGYVCQAHIVDLRTIDRSQPVRHVSDLLIAEHKIEDGAFDTVDICAWGTGRVVRRESTGR